jgi:hypothetical protein
MLAVRRGYAMLRVNTTSETFPRERRPPRHDPDGHSDERHQHHNDGTKGSTPRPRSPGEELAPSSHDASLGRPVSGRASLRSC